MTNLSDNMFVIYIANILYNIFAIPICKCNSNMFSIWTILYCKYIEQYICNILFVSNKNDIWQTYPTICLIYIYFANILYNIFAIPICKCNSNMFSVWTILYCKYIEQYICNILSVSIKMINDNPIRQYICNTYANVLDNIFAPNILCSI